MGSQALRAELNERGRPHSASDRAHASLKTGERVGPKAAAAGGSSARGARLEPGWPPVYSDTVALVFRRDMLIQSSGAGDMCLMGYDIANSRLAASGEPIDALGIHDKGRSGLSVSLLKGMSREGARVIC